MRCDVRNHLTSEVKMACYVLTEEETDIFYSIILKVTKEKKVRTNFLTAKSLTGIF